MSLLAQETNVLGWLHINKYLNIVAHSFANIARNSCNPQQHEENFVPWEAPVSSILLNKFSSK